MTSKINKHFNKDFVQISSNIIQNQKNRYLFIMSLKEDKKPTITELYNQGDFIDAKDSQGDWRVGYIVDKSDITKFFKVRFDGWAAKYDELYRFGSPKLRHFRSLVRGYTGQKKLPALRQSWKFTQAQHAKKFIQLKKYVFENNSQQAQTAHQFNQWIRGHNYFYVDFLMTSTFTSVEDIHKVIEFFKLNILFGIDYLRKIALNFDNFIQDLDKEQEQQVQQLQVAKSFAFYEIFDMLYIITGSYDRLGGFFKQNQELLRQEYSIVGNKDVKLQYQLKMITLFNENQGFKTIDNIIQLITKLNRPISWVFLYSLAHLYSGVSCVLNTKSKESIIKLFKQITSKNIQFLGDKQMKDFNHYEIIDYINQINNIAKKTSLQREIQQWIQSIQMQVYFKMITCPFFQKKLKGITSLHQFIDQNSELIEDGTVSKWISKKKLFDVLFSNDNPQLIKKSAQLIKYLYHKDNQMQKYIQLVWKYRQGKHETAMKQIYNFMGDIPLYDKNEEFKVRLFKKHLAQVDQNSWDLQYIKMIKDFTINALFAHSMESSFKQTFGFSIIYKYVQKNPSDQILLGYLIQVLEKLQKSDFIEKFITDCFVCIQKGINPNFHISLLLRIFKQKLIDLRNLKIDGRAIIQRHIILTKNEKNQNHQQKFDVLHQYLKQAKQIIEQEDFLQFWREIVDSDSRKYFFKWLFKIRDNGRVVLTSFIVLQTKAYLLQNFWTDEYLKKHPQFDQSQAMFLLELIKVINEQQKLINRSNVVIQVFDHNLIGIDKLLSAYKFCQDQNGTEILAKGLTEIYMSGAPSLKQLMIDLPNEYIQKIIDQIKIYSEGNDISGIKKMLRLIQEIISRDQQIFDVNQIIRTQTFKPIGVKNIDNNEERIFRFNLFCNAYSFKKFCAERFGIPIYKFDLIINQEQILSYQSYFKPLGQLNPKGKILLKQKNNQSSQIKMKLNHHLELLFELLGIKEIEERVWNIVSKLPISNEIRQKIIHSDNPLKIIENQSFYKELYMFKVALSLDKKWWNLQIQEMLKFFLTKLLNMSTLTQIERQYIAVSGKLLEKIIKLDQMPNSKVFGQTFKTVFQILKKILKQTKNIQSLNVQHIKKFIETFFFISDQLNTYLDKKGLKGVDPDALTLLLDDSHIENFLKLCLIEYKHQSVRKDFPTRLAKLATFDRQRYSHRLAGIILNEMLDFTVECETKTLRQYILFSCFFFETMSQYLQGFFVENKSIFFVKLFKLLENQAPQENSETTNVSLLCYMSLMRYVIKQVSPIDIQRFFAFLYNECLFKRNDSKCKSKETRSSIFNLLMRVVRHQKKPQMIYESFGKLQINGLWRSRKLQDWTITHSDRLKSSTGYTGLRNLGCICYMNSFFQQIFMIEQFRRALLLSQDPNYNPKTIDDNVLYQVKKMFLNLMYSDKKAYNPKSFCNSFKDYQGNPTNVNQQMDIDEFSGILFDRLENSLKGTKYSNLIKDTFGGVYSNQIICKGCPHFSQSEESFLSLSLTVKDKKSIYESLQTMIKGDTLDGDNAYHCQRCDKKVSAVKRVCLKSLPNYLIVALKRFQFDYNTMAKLKINQYCQFPHQLNLQQYSSQFLRKKQNPQAIQQQEQLRQKNYYSYRLKGVVIHIGYADSGHYYSLIQQRNGQERWLEFNDTIVRKFNVDGLKEEAFGGETGGLENKEKIKNAYLLIYERVDKIKSIEKEVLRQGESFKTMPMYDQIIQTLNKENFEYNIENIVFSAEYLKFLTNLIEEAAKNKQNLPLQKFIIFVFFTGIMRSKSDPGMFDIILKIYNTFGKGNRVLNEWILTQFCDPRIYDEFFRNCPIRQIKRNIASWTVKIMEDVADENLKMRFLKLMTLKITTENQNNSQALSIFHNLINQPYCLKFIIENNLIGRLHENIIRRQQRAFGSVQRLQEPQIRSQFGYEQIVERTPLQLKKFKYDNESGFVWALIFKIISKLKKQNLSKYLHKKQVQYLYMTKDKVFKLLEQAKSKFDIDVLTNYLCYLSQGNEQFSSWLIEFVERGVKEFQSKRYRQFFELFAKMLKIEDGLADERATWIFCVIRSLKENQKYAMDCTIIELWLCKIINENEGLRNYLIKEKTILEYLSSLPLKKVPSDELSKKNNIFADAQINKLHGVPFPLSRRGYIKVLKHVEQFYEKLLKGVYQPLHYFTSGNHLVYDNLTIGSTIAYFDTKDKIDYEEATVKDIFVDKILIARKTTGTKPTWIWIEDEKLTSNINVIKQDNAHELDSSKTTEMEDEIDFQAVN